MGAVASTAGLLRACWWWPLARTSSALIVCPWTGLLALAADSPTKCSLCQTLPVWRTTLTPSGMCQWKSSSGSAPTLRKSAPPVLLFTSVSVSVSVSVLILLCLRVCTCFTVVWFCLCTVSLPVPVCSFFHVQRLLLWHPAV